MLWSRCATRFSKAQSRQEQLDNSTYDSNIKYCTSEYLFIALFANYSQFILLDLQSQCILNFFSLLFIHETETELLLN